MPGTQEEAATALIAALLYSPAVQDSGDACGFSGSAFSGVDSGSLTGTSSDGVGSGATGSDGVGSGVAGSDGVGSGVAGSDGVGFGVAGSDGVGLGDGVEGFDGVGVGVGLGDGVAVGLATQPTPPGFRSSSFFA